MIKKFAFSLLVFFLLFPLWFWPPAVSADEWTQDAHDAQRTGYTPEQPNIPGLFFGAGTDQMPKAEPVAIFMMLAPVLLIPVGELPDAGKVGQSPVELTSMFRPWKMVCML